MCWYSQYAKQSGTGLQTEVCYLSQLTMRVLAQQHCATPTMACVFAGANFSQTAGCLEFCGQLLLALVTKCQKNQQEVIRHSSLEALLRDVLPGAATVEQQLLFLEILCALRSSVSPALSVCSWAR